MLEFVLFAGIVVVTLQFKSATAIAANNVVFADSLASGWADWSWNTAVNFNNASPVQTGSASSTDQDQLAIYAAQRASDGAVTLMIINKTNVALAGFVPASTAQVFQYGSSNLGTIVRQPDQPVSAAGFGATFPAASITLYVLPLRSTSGSGNTFLNLFLPFVQR